MIWFFLAALSVVYFMFVAGYTGLESKFHLIWLGLSAFLTLVGVVADQNKKGMISIPVPIRILFWLCVAGVLLVLASVVFRILKESRRKPDKTAEYMIVLGAHVNGTTISRALQNRLDTAFLYYQKHTDIKVILSGAQGKGEEVSEAEAMTEYLKHRGIPAEQMIKEEGSYNTEENIANCRALADLEERSVILVTNRFHMYRSLMICRKQGLREVQGLSAEDHPIMIPTYYLREVLAILLYRRQNKI